MLKHFFWLGLFIQSVCSYALAQDTLHITVREADSLFLARNYHLLAAEMRIEGQKALEIQTALYPNPILTGAINLYDPENKKVFHTGSTGQKEVQLEQLLLLGGKRKAEMDLAKANTERAALEFKNLIRTLKYELRTNLYAVGQYQSIIQVYTTQLERLDTLVKSYQSQAEKGNIPMKELVRLKGAYLKLNNDRSEFLKAYYDAQLNLQALLQTNIPVAFDVKKLDLDRYTQTRSLVVLEAHALENRPDVLIAEKDYEVALLTLDYQKRLAKPNLTVMASYDQRSGAFNNQVNVGVSLPLPLWNKNQGNIKAAQYTIQERIHEINAVKAKLASQIRNSYAYHLQMIAEYERTLNLYDENFDITLQAMSQNFLKRNISILEFVDFFEAHNEVIMEIGRIRIQLVKSAEELNWLTATDTY